MAVDTRARIIDATAALYRRQGLAATGLKQISQACGAPYGSIYHHFPGGKEEISVAVINAEGRRYAELVGPQLAQVTDVVDGIPALFDAAGQMLESLDYTEACSIETIALEVASTNERLRRATATVFEGWLAAIDGWYLRAGLSDTDRRRLALIFLTSLEGAFVLCRSLRSTEPMTAAGAAVQAATRLALSSSANAEGCT